MGKGGVVEREGEGGGYYVASEYMLMSLRVRRHAEEEARKSVERYHKEMMKPTTKHPRAYNQYRLILAGVFTITTATTIAPNIAIAAAPFACKLRARHCVQHL